MTEIAWASMSIVKPASEGFRSHSWCHKVAGTGLARDCIRLVAQGWRRRASRVDMAR